MSPYDSSITNDSGPWYDVKMTETDIDIGELLAKWRREAGLSQGAIAEALNTQQATISKLESGIYKLSVSQLLLFLNACGLTLRDVAEEIDEVAQAGNMPLWERINE